MGGHKDKLFLRFYQTFLIECMAYYLGKHNIKGARKVRKGNFTQRTRRIFAFFVCSLHLCVKKRGCVSCLEGPKGCEARSEANPVRQRPL
jgi:hypothetical protein